MTQKPRERSLSRKREWKTMSNAAGEMSPGDRWLDEAMEALWVGVTI